MADSQRRVEIRKVDVRDPRAAYEYGFGACLDNSLESLADLYAADADRESIGIAISRDFPPSTREEVRKGCAAGFVAQDHRGGPRAEQMRAQWMANRMKDDLGSP